MPCTTCPTCLEQTDFSSTNISANGCPVNFPGDCLFYSGAYVASPLNISSGDNFNTVVGKLSAALAEQGSISGSQWLNQLGGISYPNKVVIGGAIPNKDLTIDKAIPIFGISQGGVEKMSLGVAANTNGGVVGTVAGDSWLKTVSKKFLISTDNGTTASVIFGDSQSIKVPLFTGADDRMVIVHPDGTLDQQAIPVGGGGGTANLLEGNLD